jgi:O-antigen/teichoic acid export membrane protein
MRQHHNPIGVSKIKALSFRQNSLLNLAGGALMVLYAFLSPMVLSRAIDPKAYSAYTIGLQVVPFLLLLATPIQAFIGPKLARYRATSTDSSAEVSVLVNLAALYFLVIAAIASGLAVALSFLLPMVLGWDQGFASVASRAILYFGLAAALTIPSLVLTCYAAGNHNFLWENLLKCIGPYLGLILVVATWKVIPGYQEKLPAALVIVLSALSTLLGSLFVCLLGLRQSLELKIRLRPVGPLHIRELLKESRGTYWWQACALLSVGTGPFLISRIDLGSVAAYAIAASVMSVIAGVSTAFSGPFTIKMANTALTTCAQRLDIFRRFQSRFVMFIIIATILILSLPQSVFNLWLGKSLGLAVGQLLIPLALANLARQITSPFTAAVLGLGKQAEIWISPGVEALLSILIGALLGQFYGSQGVAYGLLVAALVRLAITLFYDLKITHTVLPLSALHLLIPREIKLRGFSKT